MGTGSESDDARDRRQRERHIACFAAELDAEGKGEHLAVIRDLSVTGARLLTRARVEVGDPLRLTLHFGAGTEPHAVPARVVRVEKLDRAKHDLWSTALGVAFDEPLVGFEDRIKELEARDRAT